jgi:hypothetical protein
MERLRHARVFIDIELHKLNLALCSGRSALEDRRKALAWSTPRSPEINDHWNGMRALNYLSLKGGIGDV